MKTENLIEELSFRVQPVRSLPHPLSRSFRWLALALPFVALTVSGIGLRKDAGHLMDNPGHLFQFLSMLALSFSAVFSAFAMGVPDKNAKRWLLFPFLALAGVALALSLEGHAGTGWKCLRNILLLGLPPASVLYVMLRRSVPWSLGPSGALALLGAGALASAGTRWICPNDEAFHFFLWHSCPLILAAACGWGLGRSSLKAS